MYIVLIVLVPNYGRGERMREREREGKGIEGMMSFFALNGREEEGC